MAENRDKPIPEFKKKAVEEFTDMINNNKTILIASCKGLPGQQFHDIKKKLRGKALVKSTKKNIINRAIDATGKGALQDLKNNIESDYVIVFSDIDPFELSGILTDNESERKAKAGDISPRDIEVQSGMTELVAGPAISELGSVGLKVKVTEGKLEIMNNHVVVKEGEEIKDNVASVLGKLNINPMKVGFIPIAAYNSDDDKVYTGIVIDKPGTLAEMKDLIGKALGFAVGVNYPCDKTIAYFIAKAGAEEKALQMLYDKGAPETASETPTEEKTETPTEEVQEKPAEAVTEETTNETESNSNEEVTKEDTQ